MASQVLRSEGLVSSPDPTLSVGVRREARGVGTRLAKAGPGRGPAKVCPAHLTSASVASANYG